MNLDTKDRESLVSQFVSIVGDGYVLSDAESCALYSQDIFTRQLPAVAVVQPANTEDLSAVVKTATDGGYEVIARGGAMSYTSGLVPNSPKAVMIDMRRMNRVLEINTDDMYVTVECGCTWKELHAALKGTGYRTAFWGALSGSKASIGGGLAQNSMFWGSGVYGTAADNVLGLEVVVADGSVVKTGSGAQLNSTPFFRHFGPDLTGVFTGDSGALGFKAVASLRLIKEFEGKQYCAFDFKSGDDAIATMSEISRRGLAMECFGFDPFLQSQRLKRESFATDAKALAGVMKSAGSLGNAIKDGAKVALAGRRYMDKVDYSVQVIIEDYNQAGADAKAKEVVSIAKRFSGAEISNSIPKIARANPFGPVNSILGPTGERWAPIHALVPHSKAMESYQLILDLFARHSEQFEQWKIETGFLFATVSSNCFVLEPVFFWPDAATEIHVDNVEADHFARLTKYPENLPARELVASVRKEFCAMFRESGGIHLQIGKAYHYADGIEGESLALVKAIKHATDPRDLLNPGALGLG